MTVEILIEPIDITPDSFVSIYLTSHQTCQERIFHGLVFIFEAATHQDGKDGVVAFIGIHSEIKSLVCKTDGIREGTVFLLELISKET